MVVSKEGSAALLFKNISNSHMCIINNEIELSLSLAIVS